MGISTRIAITLSGVGERLVGELTTGFPYLTKGFQKRLPMTSLRLHFARCLFASKLLRLPTGKDSLDSCSFVGIGTRFYCAI